MLIISLLDNQKMQPLQEWRFENEQTVKVGRAPDNNIVLQPDLVSSYHLEINQIQPQHWEIISKGRNGTFVNGQRIDKINLTDGLIAELAQGGAKLKFQLQSAVPEPAINPLPTVAQQLPVQQIATQAAPANLQQELQLLKLEKLQLQSQLEQANAARAELEVILAGINTQFPPAFFSQRQQELATRLGEIQSLQTNLETEIARCQKNLQSSVTQEQETLIKILSANFDYLQKERQSLEQFQERMKQVAEYLQQLEKHLQANGTISKKLPTNATLVDTLHDEIKQKLTELDQELGRIHEQHLLANTKQTFSF